MANEGFTSGFLESSTKRCHPGPGGDEESASCVG